MDMSDPFSSLSSSPERVRADVPVEVRVQLTMMIRLLHYYRNIWMLIQLLLWLNLNLVCR